MLRTMFYPSTGNLINLKIGDLIDQPVLLRPNSDLFRNQNSFQERPNINQESIKNLNNKNFGKKLKYITNQESDNQINSSSAKQTKNRLKIKGFNSKNNSRKQTDNNLNRLSTFKQYINKSPKKKNSANILRLKDKYFLSDLPDKEKIIGTLKIRTKTINLIPRIIENTYRIEQALLKKESKSPIFKNDNHCSLKNFVLDLKTKESKAILEENANIKLKTGDKGFLNSEEIKTDDIFEGSNKELFKYNHSNFYNKRNGSLIKFKNVDDSLSEIQELLYLECWNIMSPDKFLRKTWDFSVLILIFYTTIISPYINCDLPLRVGYFFFLDAVFDIIFIADIVINLFSPFYDLEENIVRDKKIIFDNYLSKWFIPDIIISVPFSLAIYVCSKFKTASILMNILHCFQWIRVFRVFKLFTYNFIVDIKFSKNHKLNQLFYSAVYFLLLMHILSCFWIFIAYTNISINRNLNCWINLINYTQKSDIYIASFYWNIYTIVTIGYGDIVAQNSIERLYNTVFMVVGVMFFSYAISDISTLFTTRDKKDVEYSKKIEILQTIWKEYQIPIAIHKQIKRFLKLQYKKGSDENYSLIETLPNKIKKDISKVMFNKYIKELKFFESQNDDFILFILPLLRVYKILKNTKLFSFGEYLEEMYMVTKGTLSLKKKIKFQNVEVAQIRNSNHFGDLFLYSNEVSSYDLVCKSKVCECLVLKKEDFLKVKQIFPDKLLKILDESFDNLKKIVEQENILLDLINIDDGQSINTKLKQFNKSLALKYFYDYYNDIENPLEEKINPYNTNVLVNNFLKSGTSSKKSETKGKMSEGPKLNSTKNEYSTIDNLKNSNKNNETTENYINSFNHSSQVQQTKINRRSKYARGSDIILSSKFIKLFQESNKSPIISKFADPELNPLLDKNIPRSNLGKIVNKKMSQLIAKSAFSIKKEKRPSRKTKKRFKSSFITQKLKFDIEQVTKKLNFSQHKIDLENQQNEMKNKTKKLLDQGRYSQIDNEFKKRSIFNKIISNSQLTYLPNHSEYNDKLQVYKINVNIIDNKIKFEENLKMNKEKFTEFKTSVFEFNNKRKTQNNIETMSISLFDRNSMLNLKLPDNKKTANINIKEIISDINENFLLNDKKPSKSDEKICLLAKMIEELKK